MNYSADDYVCVGKWVRKQRMQTYPRKLSRFIEAGRRKLNAAHTTVTNANVWRTTWSTRTYRRMRPNVNEENSVENHARADGCRRPKALTGERVRLNAHVVTVVGVRKRKPEEHVGRRKRLVTK